MAKKFQLSVFLAIITNLLCSCLPISNFERGIDSFKVQDYRQAFIRLKPAAAAGQADAQYAVGYMYYYGQGVVEDHEQARMWIAKAASQGQPDALKAAGILDRCKDPKLKGKSFSVCR